MGCWHWQRQVPCLTWLWDLDDGACRPGHVMFIRISFCCTPLFSPDWITLMGTLLLLSPSDSFLPMCRTVCGVPSKLSHFPDNSNNEKKPSLLFLWFYPFSLDVHSNINGFFKNSDLTLRLLHWDKVCVWPSWAHCLPLHACSCWAPPRAILGDQSWNSSIVSVRASIQQSCHMWHFCKGRVKITCGLQW